MPKRRCDVTNLNLAGEGRKKILWADRDMPVLALIRARFAKQKPLRGMRMGCCMHVTSETANLMRTLKAGGAEVALCASNPLSTQDPTAASLVKDFGVPVFARRGESVQVFYDHLNAVIDTRAADHHGRRRRPGEHAAHPAAEGRPRTSWPAWRRRPPASSGCARWPAKAS